MTVEADPDVCWHCRACLAPEPPHCDQCPPPGDCDVLGCDEPGCSGAPPVPTRLDRCLDLLRRVIDDGNDLASLRALASDIANELGVPDRQAQN